MPSRFSGAVKCKMSDISRIFSPINRPSLQSVWASFIMEGNTFNKVAPYSFLTARELVSKSRDDLSFKKSTRKMRATSTTASNSHWSNFSSHCCSFSVFQPSFGFSFLFLQTCALIFPNIAFRQDIRAQHSLPCCQNFGQAGGTSGPLIRMRAWSSRKQFLQFMIQMPTLIKK